MRSIITRVLFGLLFTSALGGCVDASTAPGPTRSQTTAAAPRFSAERLARLDEVLQNYVDQRQIAGAVLRIQQDGHDVYFKAFGWRDKEAGDPMREDTIFRLASQTKALTSVAAMMLMEEGKLLLTDPVGKHLPEWASTNVAVARPGGGYDVVPAKRAITIRDLLAHTAGISYGAGPAEKAWRDADIFGWYFGNRSEPVSSVVARMASLPMAAQPGEFVYGYGTDVIGVIVEKVSGQRLDAFLDERLIRPLGMKDTSFYVPREKANRLAVVYSAEADGIRRAPDAAAWQAADHYGQGHFLDGPKVAFSGGGGLVSTAADYSRFLEMLRRGGELEGRRYLSRKSVELMTTDHLTVAPSPGMGFGLGFLVREDLGQAGQPGTVGEFGWAGAYQTLYWVDPQERLTVAYMVQLRPAGSIDHHGKLRALIYQALE